MTKSFDIYFTFYFFIIYSMRNTRSCYFFLIFVIARNTAF